MMREKLEALAKDIGPDLGMFMAQWAAQQEMGVEQEALSTLVVPGSRSSEPSSPPHPSRPPRTPRDCGSA